MNFAPLINLLNKTIGVYNIRGFYIEPTYWEVAAIILLLFLLVLTLARIRYLYVHWHMGKQNISMLFWGFLVALIFEGLLIISGRTMFSEILGWKNPPKPISTVIDITRHKLADVLGTQDSIPESRAVEKPTYQSVVSSYQSLTNDEASMVKAYICKPE